MKAAPGLSNHIFKNYYKDALLSLSQQQRISYQLIHSMVDQMNIGLQELREMTLEIQKERFEGSITLATFEKRFEQWGETVKAQYVHCGSLLWQIRYHRQHRHYPSLSPNTRHPEEYARYVQDMALEANKFIEGGKTISPEKFSAQVL